MANLQKTYRQQQIEIATTGRKEALEALAAAKTNRQRRDARDLIEFWGNKLAFLTNLKCGLFGDEK